MRAIGPATKAALLAWLLVGTPAAVAHANQTQPAPTTSDDSVNRLGPPSVIEAQPSVGPPLSSLATSLAASIDVRSGGVGKTLSGGGMTSLPIGQGLIEGLVHFPATLDGRHTSVTLQQTGDGQWQVQSRDPPSADTVAFALRGAGASDLIIDVQPPLGGTGVQFGLRLTPTTVITTADAGQTVQLQQHERFSLELGPGYIWTVIVADETIVSRVADGELIYEALAPGTTTLLVSSDPACRRCFIPSPSFEVHLIVT